MDTIVKPSNTTAFQLSIEPEEPTPSILYEYLMFNNCNNKCEFCPLAKDKIKFPLCPNKELHRSADLVVEDLFKIKDPAFKILLVGGELFASKDSKYIKRLNNLAITISTLFTSRIETVYINTNLLHDPQQFNNFINFLDIIAPYVKVKVITSYDIYGRFNSDETRLQFKMNLNRILTYIKKFPNILVSINTILTRPLIKDILKKPKVDFVNELTVKLHNGNDIVSNFLIPYMSSDTSIGDKFLPTYPEIINVFYELLKDEASTELAIRSIENLTNTQPRILKSYNSTKDMLETIDTKYNPCGHSVNFNNMCSDKKCCLICELQRLLSLLNY